MWRRRYEHALRPVPVAVAPNGGDTRGPGPGGGTTTDPAVPETAAETGFDVFLLAGQSNMVGWDKNFDPVLDAPDPRILQLGFWNDHRNFVIPAIDPLDHPQRDNGVGLAMQFSRAYLNDLPKGRGILLVPSAFGGTGFYQQRWNPGNDLFEQAVERANAAMATHPSNRFAGILWHQGEDDVRFWGSQPARYAAALDAAIYGFRARIAGAASAPMILGKFTDSWGLVDTTFNAAGETTAAKANIMQAIDETPSAFRSPPWPRPPVCRLLPATRFTSARRANGNTGGAISRNCPMPWPMHRRPSHRLRHRRP